MLTCLRVNIEFIKIFGHHGEVELEIGAHPSSSLLNLLFEHSVVYYILFFTTLKAVTSVIPCVNSIFKKARPKCVDQVFTTECSFSLVEKWGITKPKILVEQLQRVVKGQFCWYFANMTIDTKVCWMSIFLVFSFNGINWWNSENKIFLLSHWCIWKTAQLVRRPLKLFCRCILTLSMLF